VSAYLCLSPMSAAVYTRLNVAALTTTLGVTGIFDDVKQGTTPPFIEFFVREARQLGGLGTEPGNGQMPLVELRVHVLSSKTGMKQAQTIMAKAIELLYSSPLSVSGHSVHMNGRPYTLDTVPLFEEIQGGIKVNELVTVFEYYVEEAA
jgi:hypothetical protein